MRATSPATVHQEDDRHVAVPAARDIIDDDARAALPYQAPRWNEPLIFALHSDGARGVIPARADPRELARIPESPEARVQRQQAIALPEISQPQVLRHFLRLSQETLGADLNVDIGQGTCTIKYSPKINETFVRSPRAAATHPLQDPSTVQGTLRIIAELEQYLAVISGMDAVSVQAPAGSAAIWGNVQIVRAYHRSRGEGDRRDEVITTIFSHPSNAATAHTAGYRVITLYPDADGLVSEAAVRAALSPRTAALMITNPEDTGIFNPAIDRLVRAAHEVGALCVYDQANANGLLGITTARAAGFDLCHFNLHKTFSTPHACGGPAAGAICATAALAPFLPGTRIREEDGVYTVQPPGPQATASLRPFYGVIPNIIRAYAWIRALGADGLREVAEGAVLSNNYVMSRILRIPGVTAAYLDNERRPIEQVRYSWQKLTQETGVTSSEIGQRMADFGMHYWTSHHPYVIPEPATIEPTESYSRRELDDYVRALAAVASEARTDPERTKAAPHHSSIHQVDPTGVNDPTTWATSWRAFRRKYLGADMPVPRHWEPAADAPAPIRPAKAFHR